MTAGGGGLERLLRWALPASAAALLGFSPAAGSEPPPLSTRYELAERFMPWNASRYMLNGAVEHHWLPGQDRFWYQRQRVDDASEFRMVDAASGRNTPAFDHATVASGLSAAQRKTVDPGRLPFSAFRFAEGGSAITFGADGRTWTCRLDRPSCDGRAAPSPDAGIPSPDGRWTAFLRDHDLWLRANADGREFALTTDGEAHNGYAVPAGNNTHFISLRKQVPPFPPLLVWSPDSKRILTHRLDERGVGAMHLVQHVPDDDSLRPKLYDYRSAFAGEAVKAIERIVILDIEKRRQAVVDHPKLETIYQTIVEDKYAWWSPDGSQAYIIVRGPYAKTLTLGRIDPASGRFTPLVREAGETFVEIAEERRIPRTRILPGGDILWFSERDGYGHLYVFDARGRLKRQITKGKWNVLDVVHVDEKARRIFFSASGREPGDPYLRHLYSIGFDGAGLRHLTPEDADHDIRTPAWDPHDFGRGDGLSPFRPTNGFSPTGRYFVETFSRRDMPPTTVLRTADGRQVAIVERADISPLKAGGFREPMMFEVLAADGRTKLYGSLFLPSHFDPARRYPVLDSIYPGPQMHRVHRDFATSTFDYFEAQSLAELGFVVMALDGRGTPHRSRAFLHDSYGQLGKAGNLEDHVAALRQLGERHAFIDTRRIGIFGHSGGGFAAARAILSYPDVFKVAVASAGNHHQLLYVAGWGETYNGPDDGRNYAAADNAALAGNLRGKLLLVHGDMDDNIHPAQTLRLTDAFIRHGKNFDQLIIPNANHQLLPTDPNNIQSRYFVRRRWNYFIEHLLGERPAQ